MIDYTYKLVYNQLTPLIINQQVQVTFRDYYKIMIKRIIISVIKNNINNNSLYAGYYNLPTAYMDMRIISGICYRSQYYFSNNNNKTNHTLTKYDKLRNKQKLKQKINQNTNLQPQQNNTSQNNNNKQQHYIQNLSINCQGCNVRLQSKDKTKYGYINQKILTQALQHNISTINQHYGDKAKNRDAKILDFMHEVQKQSGIKIFNQATNQMDNLDNIQVLVRLQEKIQKYEQNQQLLHTRKKVRKQILCFRCFSLKHHNRLPQQYDNNQTFTTDSTQFILNKLTNRHKGTHNPIEYLYLIDAFDIIGTFQEWLFSRLINQKLQVCIIVNKIDVINKEYINQAALRNVVKARLRAYLTNMFSNHQQVQQYMNKIHIFYISCNSRDGIKKLKQHVQKTGNNIQLIGFPNTGKTTLLNILSKIKKSTSKIPGTTVKITEHNYGSSSKIKVYDMPGLYSQKLLYNLITKPSIKSMLTWHKRIAPGLLTKKAFIYGGKIEIQDVRIIVFGHGGACQSSNKWFIDHYKQFWNGLPHPNLLNIKKYQIDIEFIDGRADDLQIGGYGFIGFRLCIPNIKKTRRKLILFLPQKIEFGFRSTILSTNDSIFHNKSGVTKKFMLQRLTIKQKDSKSVTENKKQKKKEQQKPNISDQLQMQMQMQTKQNNHNDNGNGNDNGNDK